MIAQQKLCNVNSFKEIMNHTFLKEPCTNYIRLRFICKFYANYFINDLYFNNCLAIMNDHC